MLQSERGKTPSLKTVEKALGILDHIAQQGRAVSATEISEQMGLSLSSAYKFLTTLTGTRYLDLDPATKKYWLSTKFITYSGAVQNQLNLRQVVYPHMQKLSAQTGETIHLGIVDRDEGVFVDKINSTHTVSVSTRVGNRTPLHQGATMKVMLAHMGEDFIGGYLKRQRDAGTLPDEKIDLLRKEIADIRAQGVAVSFEELNAGAVAISAPVLLANGELAGAVAIAGPISRFPDHLIAEYKDMVREECTAASRKMGYQPL